jgi:hypothetical protein
MNNIVALRIAADQRKAAAESLKVVEFRTSYDYTAYGRRTVRDARPVEALVPVRRVSTSPLWVEDERGIPQRVR